MACFTLFKGGKSTENSKRKIFVGGLPASCDQAQLKEFFRKYDSVSVFIVPLFFKVHVYMMHLDNFDVVLYLGIVSSNTCLNICFRWRTPPSCTTKNETDRVVRLRKIPGLSFYYVVWFDHHEAFYRLRVCDVRVWRRRRESVQRALHLHQRKTGIRFCPVFSWRLSSLYMYTCMLSIRNQSFVLSVFESLVSLASVMCMR